MAIKEKTRQNNSDFNVGRDNSIYIIVIKK